MEKSLRAQNLGCGRNSSNTKSFIKLRNILPVLFFVLLGYASSAQFTSGNLVVERLGDGAATLSGNAARINLVEYNTSTANQASAVSTVTLPNASTAPTSAPFNVTESGSASNSGLMSLSSDGSTLVISGYNQVPGGAVTPAAWTSNSRTIARVNSAGTITSGNLISTATAASSAVIRSACSDGTGVWLAGNAGVYYVANSTATAATSIATTGNYRQITIQNGNLYATTAATVVQIGTGLPTTSATATALTLGTAPGGANAIAINAAGTVMYLADDGGGIRKYTFSAGTWTQAYVLNTSNVRGLVVDWSAANASTGVGAVCYATTTATNNNTLIKVTDAGSAGATATTLASAGTNLVFRGVAFAPQSAGTPSVAFSTSHPTAGSINVNSVDNVLASYALATTTATATLTGVSFTMAGTYTSSDLSNIRVYINSANNLTGATLLGTPTTVGTGGTISLTGLTASLPSGTTRHILVTASVASGANVGATVSLASTSLANFTLAAGNKTGTDPASASNAQTIASVPPSIDLSTPGPAGGNLPQNTSNAIIRSVQMTVTNAAALLNAVSFTTAGTYATSDIQTNGFRVYYNTTNSLTGATLLSTNAVVPSGGSISATGLSQVVPIGTSYLIVTASAAFNATAGNTLSIAANAFSSFTFAAGSLTGTDPVAAGNEFTFTAVSSSAAISRTAPTTAANLGFPSTDNIIYQMGMAVTLNSAVLNSVSFTTAGTYLIGDIGANMKLWYNSSNSFATATTIATTASVASGNTVSFTGLSQFIPVGSTGWVWLTIDINGGSGRNINIASVANTSVTFAGGVATGTAVAGAVQTFLGIPQVTEIMVPQYIAAGTSTARVHYVYRVKLSNLIANATYRYANNAILANDLATVTGAGVPVYLNSASAFSKGSNTVSTAGQFSTFTTDSNGEYTGWFGLESTGNATYFTPGLDIKMRIILNDGNNGTTIQSRVVVNSNVRVLDFGVTSGANECSGIYNTSFGSTAKNLVAVYDNTSGTGRPLSIAVIESDGLSIGGNNATFHANNVEGLAGAWGTLIPNVNANGVRRIEQFSLTSGATVGCPLTDADGVIGSVNTVNPTAGNAGALALASINFTTPTWYADTDNDGFGNPAVTLTQCSQPAGYVADNTDCNDTNAAIYPAPDTDGDGYTLCTGDCNEGNAAINPGASEICDGIDNNCNVSIDETPPSWYFDNDGDGFGAGAVQLVQCADPGAGYSSNNNDCDDSNNTITFILWYLDADADGYGTGVFLNQCAQPIGYYQASSLTATTGDCDDSNAALNPGTLWYQDADGDTFGNPSSTQASCTQPLGFVANSLDCNDANANIKPGATEISCNGIDENCNSAIDENSTPGCTDFNASNYNSNANCEDGTCTYTASFTAGNLVVSRVGLSTAEDALDTGGSPAALYNISASLTGNTAAQQLVIDQFNTTSTLQLPVNSYRIPKAGTSVLTSSGTVQSEGQLTRALDGSAIYMTGFAGYAGRAAIAQTSSSAVSRVVGRLGIDYSFSRVASTNTLFSGSAGNNQNMRTAITDGTNWWAAGSNSGVAILSGTQQSIVNDILNFRNINIIDGQLYASTAFNISTPSVIDRGIYMVGSGLPTSANQVLTPVITDPTNLMSPYGFQFNAAQDVCYIADDRTNGDGGVLRYDKAGSTWTLTRTMTIGNGLGATGLYVDFYTASTPTIYVVASNGGNNTRLFKFQDTGTSTPATSVLAVAPANTAFRSVALAPCTDVAWYRDADGDGFGDGTDVIMFCTQPLGYVNNNTDCDDADALEFPGQVWYVDVDNDGYSSGTSLVQCTRPTDYKVAAELTATSGDCNDNDAAVNPGATEVCNSVDDNCDTQIDSNQLTINTSYSGVGSITPAGPAVFSCGDSQTFTITPDPCYSIDDVEIDGVSVGGVTSYTFTDIQVNHDIDVVFTRRSFAVTVNTTGLGSVTGPATALCGGDVAMTVAAADCYTIESITVNGTSVLSPGNGFGLYSLDLLNVTEDQVVDVVFSQVEFTLTATAALPDGTSATITPDGTITRLCGTSQTYSISLGDCTELINVRVNGNDLGPVTSFNIDEVRGSYSISFQCQRATYDVTATTTVGGGISPGGTQTYLCGASPVYNISPAPGYGIAGVTVDGIAVGAITSYTFDNISVDHTIDVVFAPQPATNSWSTPQSLINPNFPSCVNNSFTLAGCSESSQSTYYPAPAGAGQDAWFRFRVPTTSTGVVRISAGSSVNDLAVILQKEEATSPFYSQVGAENSRAGVGSEFMTMTNLIPGAYYRVGIKNMGLQTAGAFTMCISSVRAVTCGTSTSPTSGVSICDVFNGSYTGATSYTYTFTNQSNSAETFSRNLNGVSGGPAPTALPLNSIPGLRYGASYDVKIDATYTFTDGNGGSQTYTVTGNPQACVLYTRTQPNSELSAADRCANGPKTRSSVISTGWVCGAVDYVWEVTPTTGLPIAYLTNRGIGDRFMRVASLNGMNTGATTFNVRVRPRFSNGLGGFNEGSFGPTQQLCIVTPAMNEYQGEEEVSLKSVSTPLEVVIYPNPNSGDAFVIEANDLTGNTLRVRILDVTGKVIWSNQYSTTEVFSTNVVLDRELSNGLYMVEMTNGEVVRTQRMVVSK
jgi:hypothetical protein